MNQQNPETSSNAFDVHGHPMDLLGWPGYRNAAGRSGLGYLETQAEWAHMQGLFFRWMITGKFKTRHPLYLLMIALYGFTTASPLLLLFAGAEGRDAFLYDGFFFVPYTVIGILLLVNVVLSLVRCDPGESITGD